LVGVCRLTPGALSVHTYYTVRLTSDIMSRAAVLRSEHV
jgi:hypothetical protein